MVAKIQKRAGSVIGCLEYNIRKVDEEQACVVAARNLPYGAEYDPSLVSRYMRRWEKRCRRMKKTGFQMNVDPSDGENATMSREDIMRYIDGMMSHLGYGKQPYIVYEHNDIDRRHFHIVSVRVDGEGKGIPTHMEGVRVKEYSIAHQQEFGFVYGRNPNEKKEGMIIHSRFEKRRGHIKAQIGKFVSGCLRLYSFETQPQFAKILRHYGIAARWRRFGDDTILACQGIDNQGKAATRTVVMDSSLTERILEACRQGSRRSKEDKDQTLQRLYDAYYQSKSMEQLQRNLASQNMELILDYTKDGSRIFGVTVIDHNRNCRAAYKGSELDKALVNDVKAGIFMQRPIEAKTFDPWELAKEVGRKFATMAGYDAIMKPGVFGLVVQDGEVILSYGGRKFIGMQPNSSNMTLYSKSASDFADKLNSNNIYSFIGEAKKYVLSEGNIARVKAPVMEQDNVETIRNSQQTHLKR